MGSSHRVLSFRNRLLQCGSPMRSQVLPANLLQCGLLSPWVHRSWQEGACSSVGFPQGHSLLQASTCSSVGSLPRATGGYLLHRGPPWAAGGATCLIMVFIKSCKGGLSASASRGPPPRSFTDLNVCRVVSLTSSHSCLSTAASPQIFFPF